MDIGLFLQQKSWIGFIVYIVIKELWPFFRDKLYPARIAEEHMLRERRMAIEERDQKDRERNIIAIESMSLGIQQMALAMTAGNERTSSLNANFTEHASFVVTAISDMREKVALIHHHIPPAEKDKKE